MAQLNIVSHPEENVKEGLHVVFIGFMGSGKTTISHNVGKMFKRRVIDTDKLIERRCAKTIKEIFAEEGESGFRKREHETLVSLLGEPTCIVSCGGGVVVNPDNIPVLKRLGKVVYLKASIECTLSRIKDTSTRPLLSGPVPPGELLAARIPLYEAAADIVIDTDWKSIEEVTNEVAERLWKEGVL